MTRLLPALLLAAFLGGAVARAVDDAADGPIASPEPGWPQWRGPARDGLSAETNLLTTWPSGGPPLLWTADGLGSGWSCPVGRGDTVYVTGDVGSNLIVFALNSADGRERWRATNGAAWRASYPGARSCGALAGDRYYHLNAHGRLACLDAATGRERWAVDLCARFDTRPHTWGLSECVLVDGDRVIVTPAGPRTLVAALDWSDGRTLWQTGPLSNEVPSYVSPILVRHGGRRLLLSGTSHHVWAVDADQGRLVWSIPFHGRWGATVSTPVYGGRRVFFAAPDGPGGRQYRVPATGDPEPAWEGAADVLTGSGILRDGVLYANGCKDTKTLQALDWTDGHVRADYTGVAAGRPAGHASAAMLWAEGRLYALFDDGMVSLLRPGPDGFAVDGRFELTKAIRRDAWAHPVLLDGRLYLRHHERLWCFDVRRRP